VLSCRRATHAADMPSATFSSYAAARGRATVSSQPSLRAIDIPSQIFRFSSLHKCRLRFDPLIFFCISSSSSASRFFIFILFTIFFAFLLKMIRILPTPLLHAPRLFYFFFTSSV